MPSKVASYLQEHILGEVSTNGALLKAMSHDASVLEVVPEMVVYPRVTNDIRKIARFAWQLAEKGHVLPLTARGAGTDETGAAIGKGVIINTTAHMDQLLELDVKQKLVRVQPGVNAQSLHDALMVHGISVPSLPSSAAYSTIGGAVANNAGGPLSGKYGSTGDWVQQLEVVLANGDLLQTERLSKRELGKKKGLQTFEGEIYRTLDSLIEDNKQLIDEKIAVDIRDNAGYMSIVKVKQKDGSFDLTPLFVGAQGTLGIISEMIMKTDFMSLHTGVALLAFTTSEGARDALDQLRVLEPAFLDYYDGDYFTLASEQGKVYDFYKNLTSTLQAVVLVGFDDFNERSRSKKLKKIVKTFAKTDVYVETADGNAASELLAIRQITAYSLLPALAEASAPSLIDGAYVPSSRFEEFSAALAALATKHHVLLPIHSRVLESIMYTRPTLHMHKVSDKQKIFKLLEEYGAIVAQFGGHLVADSGEGRLKTRAAQMQIDDDLKQLFTGIKAIFDPYGTLNPGVKQVSELRQLTSQLRSTYDTASFANYVPYN
jgi:FAD/FMN-containing dehydrogenase